MEEDKLVQRKSRALQEQKLTAYDAAVFTLGNFYSDAGQYEKALGVFVEATTVFRGKPQFRMTLGRAHRMVAEMQVLLENFGEAVLHVDKFLRIAQQEDNAVEEQRAYATVGRVHLVQGQGLADVNVPKMNSELRKAESAFVRSLQVCKRLPANIGRLERIDMEARLYLNLGVTKECLGDLDGSEQHMQKALTLARDNNLHELLHQCYTTTASFVYNKRDDVTKALRLLNLALGVAERLDKRKKCETLLSKADIFIKSGDFQSARQTLHRAYRMRTPVEHDHEMIEKMLRTVAAICRAEDQLVTTASSDYAAKKTLFELLGDGSCQLRNFTKALDYYKLMLENAEKSFVTERELVPIYVSLYQTFLDLSRYEEALVYLWKEYNLVKDAPKEAMTTLMNIAEALELSNKTFWDIDEILQKARTESKLLKDQRSEANIVRKMIALREKHRMITLAEVLREEAAAVGLNLTEKSGGDDDGNESESSEKNTLEIGNDIDLNVLTGSDSDSDDSRPTEKPQTSVPNASSVMQRSRRGQSTAVKRNEKGETALHQACISGNIAQVKRLLDQRHPVNIRDFAGWMPLHEAANHGHLEIVQLLIDRGASINDKGGKMCDGVTALHDACGNGCLEVVEVLLDAGANATMRTDLCETPVDTLEKWAKSQRLGPVEQNLYDSVHARLLLQIERTGVKRTKVTPQKKRNSQRSPVKRIPARPTPMRSMSNSSSSDEEYLTPRPSATTIDAILDDEFATQFHSDLDDDRCSSADQPPPAHSDSNNANNVSEYRNVMDSLRTGNNINSPLKRLSVDSSCGAKRRAGMLDTQEVGENWLDQDIVSVRKKPKMLSLSLGTQRASKVTPQKRQQQSKENNHPNRSSPGVPAQNGINSDENPVSVDAFDMMMSSMGKVSSSTVRRRISNTKPSSSSFKQSNSLLSSGFVQMRSECSGSSDNDEHLVSSTFLDSEYPTVVPATAVLAPIIPVGSTFKVRVKDQLLNVPVNNDMIGDLTIGWLAEEAARRYYNLKGLQPVLEITSSDGAVYESSDPLAVVLGTTVGTTVLEWILPSFAQRYLESCRQLQSTPDDGVKATLELIQATHSLTLTDQMLKLDISKPMFKAMHHQSNIESIDLTNNFLEDDSCRFLADALVTLTKLKSLKLAGNFITHHGMTTLAQKLTASSLAPIEVLDLSHNPLGDQGIVQLASIISHCPALRSLHLCSVDITHLADMKLSGITALDVSHNAFSLAELRKFLRHLNACKISKLNLGFCQAQTSGSSQALAEFLQSGTLASLNELNLNGWNLDDGDVFEIAQTLRRANDLESLYLMENSQIGTIGFMQLVQHIQVTRLFMDGCSGLLRHLASNTETISNQTRTGCKWIRLSFDGSANSLDTLKRFWTRLQGNAANVEVVRRQVFLCD